ncbi:MAG: patatin-like phospholipase family protein [Planctomycetota bacterium]
MRRKRVGLVLGGGGVKGLAHFGVLRVLDREGVAVDQIVGTSAGAIAGAMYSLATSAEEAIGRAVGYLTSAAFRRYRGTFEFRGEGVTGSFFRRLFKGIRRQLAMELLFRRHSIFPGETLARVVHGLVREARFEQGRVPLAVTAIDLRRGRQVVLNRGDLIPALLASSSVPGFFPPVPFDDMLLADAGLIDNMPVRVAKSLGAETTIAVNLNYYLEELDDFPTGIEVMFRSEEIGTKMVNDLKAPLADVVITPDLRSRYWLDFEDLDGIIEAGEDAAMQALDRVHRAIDGDTQMLGA